MQKSLTLPKESFTNEPDFECEYCNSTEPVESGRTGDTLELKCTGCGRHGKATSHDGTIQTDNFFTHRPAC